MQVTDCQLIGIRTSYSPMPSAKPPATLAEIKKVIQPMLSKWAAQFDLTVQRRKYHNGELSQFQTWLPKRGAKNWVSLRSDKKLHIFEIGVQRPDVETEHNMAVKEYAKVLEQFIKDTFKQDVPVTIGRIPTYTSGTVTSGESSSAVFRGEEITDPEEWF